jgi:hypothetical protein
MPANKSPSVAKRARSVSPTTTERASHVSLPGKRSRSPAIGSSRRDADSAEQRAAEHEILKSLERRLGMCRSDSPKIQTRLSLDGFGITKSGGYVCVEIYARQGSLKGAQFNKVLADACKMLLVEAQLGRTCRKILAFACERAAAPFREGSNSWTSAFLAFSGVEVMTATLPKRHRQAVLRAQDRQAAAQARAPKR